MNERIRELAIEAGYTTDMVGVGHWDMPECKKFAELIVAECAEVTRWQEHNMSAEQRLRLEIYQDIKKHFGVK